MLHIFVKHVIVLAMGRTFRERELTSSLLVSLVPSTIPYDQLTTGLLRLLTECDDLVLDVPSAAHLASLFLARLLVDEVLPPVFLTTVLESLRADTLGVAVIRQTANLLSSRHAAVRATSRRVHGYQH